ncbi:MAG: hypothetical protein ACUVTH_07060 [Thermogutta sp.]
MNVDDKTTITPLSSSEAFRDLNEDAQTIINTSKAVKRSHLKSTTAAWIRTISSS